MTSAMDEFVCSKCGATKVVDSTILGDDVVEVEPCENCLNKEYRKGYNDALNDIEFSMYFLRKDNK